MNEKDRKFYTAIGNISNDIDSIFENKVIPKDLNKLHWEWKFTDYFSNDELSVLDFILKVTRELKEIFHSRNMLHYHFKITWKQLHNQDYIVVDILKNKILSEVKV